MKIIVKGKISFWLMVIDMKKMIRMIMCCSLLALNTGCDMKEVEKDRITDIGATTEYVTKDKSQEEQPVLSEESLANIESALDSDDNKKYATYIAKYMNLSGLSVDTIVNAKVIEKQDAENRILVELKDSEDRVYVVVLTQKYGLIGIKENSVDGQWVFTVTYD